jgi:hypothetical protein
LRDVTRYRRSLVRDRTREKQRVEKLLDDTQIKLSSVINLGADYYDTRLNPERRAHNLATTLEAVTSQKIIIRGGKAIIIEPAA